jgi:hypothetical protein
MHEMDNAQTRKKARPEATEGDWWRFSMYEIRDGCICPSEGAKLEWYDPWPDFQNTRGQTIGQAPDGSQPGYQSLMKLVAQLEYLPGPGQTRYPDCLTQKSQTLIVEWCRQNGLLGVLLSRWEAIRVAPQEGRTDRWSQKRYSCGFGQVVQVQTMTGDVNHRPATVLIHELNDLTLVEESPGKTWSRFFPSVEFSKRDSFAYPQPYTVEFCRLYGEPLFDFCNAATLLVGAMSHLGFKQPEVKGDQKLAREQANDTINLLRRPVASTTELEEDGSLKPHRVSPSLIASFADMFVEDLLFGRTIVQCSCCGTLFVSSNYQAHYCSVLCRLREQKRRLRAQMKQAKALHAQGQSLRQIASTVGQPREIIKGWLESAKADSRIK